MMHKLTKSQVKLIRASYPSKTCEELARIYGVSVRTIKSVLLNRTWYDRTYQPPLPRSWKRSRTTKLTREQVAQIRASGGGLRGLAERFGVSESTISRVLRGRTW